MKLLDSCGFEVERVRHFNLRDNAPAMASSLFPAWIRSVGPSEDVPTEVKRRLAAGVRHIAYLAVVILSYPPAALEAALGRGGTLTVQARRL